MMAQFETIFGKTDFENFALSSDRTLIDKMEGLLGKENYQRLRQDMNLSSKGKKVQYRFTDWQNLILHSYFDRAIQGVRTLEDAEGFLSKLRQMDQNRIRVKGDNYFQNYYVTKFQELKNRFPNLDEYTYGYQEQEFHPTKYYEEKIRDLDDRILTYGFGNPETMDDFSRIHLTDYKRYRAEIGENIYELLTENGNIRLFNLSDRDGNLIDLYWGTYLRQRGININDILTGSEGKVFMKPLLLEGREGMVEMKEIALGISKKDIYERMITDEKESIQTETFLERIKRKIKGVKRLPPYSEVPNKYKDQGKESKTWSLTPEQRANIRPAGGSMEVLPERKHGDDERDN